MTTLFQNGQAAERSHQANDIDVQDADLDQALDDLIKLAAYLSKAPIATIALSHQAQLQLKSCVGLDSCEIDSSIALATPVLHGGTSIVIEDIDSEILFSADSPDSNQPRICFYAGFPLTAKEGSMLGVLSVMARSPHSLDAIQRELLQSLARQAARLLELKLELIRSRKDGDTLQAEREELVDRKNRVNEKTFETDKFFRAIFESLPESYIILTSDDEYRVVAANNGRLRATMTRREDILGKKLFDIFPDNPDDPVADGVANLRASLERVKSRRETDVMAVQCYPVRRPMSEGGGFVERYWTPINSPVLDANGAVMFIIHRVEDVTEYVLSSRKESLPANSGRNEDQEIHAMEVDIVLRSNEIKCLAEHLRESKQRFRSAFTNLLVGFGFSDLDGKFIEVNDRFAEIIGYSKEEIYTLRISDITHPDDWPAITDVIHKLLTFEAHSYQIEKRYIHKGGRIIWVRNYVALVYDSQGQPSSIVVIVIDITQEKEAQERLEQRDALLRLAGRMAKVGGWSVDLSSGKLIWSEEICVIHEVGPETSGVVEDALHYYPPEWRVVISEAFNSCARDGTPYDLEAEIVTAKGRRIWIRTMGEAQRNSQGKIVAVRGALLDISDRRRGEEALRESASRLTNTLESITDGFYALDKNWHFKYVNRSAEIRIGSRMELLNKNIWKLFPEAVKTRIYSEFHRAVRERRKISFTEYYLPFNKWFEVNCYPSSDGLAVYFQDITERRASEQQLRLLETCIERLNDAVIILKMKSSPDAQPSIVYVNQAFTRQTGYTVQEIIGKETCIPHGPETQPAELERIRTAIEQGKPVQAELIGYKKSGEEFWFELDIVPVTSTTSHPSHWVSIMRDITVRKHGEQQILASKKELQLLYERLQTVREEERLALAREVHDQLGQILTAAKIDIKLLEGQIYRQDMPLSRGRILTELGSAGVTLEKAIQTVREIATELRPPELDEQGLRSAIEWHARDFERRTRIRCNITVDEDLHEPGGAIATALFRIFQEAMTNVLRHAEASQVWIRLVRRGNAVLLRVRDNGLGIERAHVRSAYSIGLKGMRERAAIIKGRLVVGPLQPRGTLVTVRVPLPETGGLDRDRNSSSAEQAGD